jgi:predicted heme/steroid binding protein
MKKNYIYSVIISAMIFCIAPLNFVYAVEQAFEQEVEAEVQMNLNRQELPKYDGIRKILKYVAIEGFVYDVTGNAMWDYAERHLGLKAGTELSEQQLDDDKVKEILTKIKLKRVAKLK